MFQRFRRSEDALFERFGWRTLHSHVERGAFRLLSLLAVLVLLSLVPGDFGTLCGVFAGVTAAILVVCLLVLVYRWTFSHLLWTVRNRLVLTCVLMGLAPVLLFGILAGIAAYVFSGQFATTTATVAINSELGRLRNLGSLSGTSIENQIEAHPSAPALDLPTALGGASLGGLRDHADIAAWQDGRRLLLQAGERAHTASGKALPVSEVGPSAFAGKVLPAWLGARFDGIVERDGKLYLCTTSSDSADAGGSHPVTTIATRPLDSANLSGLATGIGSISILPGVDGEEGRPAARVSAQTSGRAGVNGDLGKSEADFAWVQGGKVPGPAHFFDNRVFFSAPLHIRDWNTGQDRLAVLGVVSRPTLLYTRLFATSVRIGTFVRNALIVIAIVFGLLELVAFLMAVRLSRTITRSIADLYGATTQIDRGNLAHRIHVERDDQLGALATSFNTMAGSLAALLEEQREKERMQGELAIAQEVQNNLFPHKPSHLPLFEIYGICKPARTVSGDYYDFIHSGDHEICLALGDISGKGISAALLMASLHSAVRAYHAGEALPAVCNSDIAGTPSPATLLGQLNRHLYSSTQPEKYATLFLACYNSTTRNLTYANGGHLTPFILCADGQVKRLDCGGSVVGLLDGLDYVEATVQLSPGDLLLAYSDGLTEPENDFGEFGEDRLLELVHQNRNQPLAAIANQALRTLGHWIGASEQPDDMTLVLARQL
jgi:sigma-B regulation protein RsbU (phosphoserine phosphatase)